MLRAPLACAQVLQRYFTPQSAAMAEFALASAVVRRVKGASRSNMGAGGEARLSPVQSLSGREGARPLSPQTPEGAPSADGTASAEVELQDEDTRPTADS